ncbi:M48 family metalloprotease [bacterium]|nr:M48 family metalloprotease [bacterium]
MSILITCDSCQSAIQTKDEYAGRRIRCPKCETVLTVPGTEMRTVVANTANPAQKPPQHDPGESRSEQTAVVTPDRAGKRSSRAGLSDDPAMRYRQLETDVIRAIDGSIEPVRVPLAYRLGILLVLIVMVLLPLIYLSLIGVAGYAVYWHAANHTGLLTADLGGSGRNAARAKMFAALLYVAPMIIGGILILFMFKPLLSRPSRQRKPRTLSREKEPLLFAFVDRLCDAVHAPRPKRIDVDLQVNASASFRSGLLSMLGSDLVLTVGLPLVAGLNMRQFAGVLAHEFGHFSQGAGMRMTFLIRSIAYWFERVVNERDEWDERLTQWSREWDLRVGWILWLARGFVWLTRRILWCLMMIGHVVAGFMLRQMEFDADRHEARFSGSDAFTETMNALPMLALADQQSWNQLGSFYQEGRLVDDLPRLSVMNSRQLPKEAHDYLAKMTSERPTGLFDTHPANKDRIASAERENAPGIFRLKHPAAFLFRSFPALCRVTTADLYRELFGRKFNPDTLASVDELIAHQQAEEEDHTALRRFFQKQFTFYRPLQISADAVAPPDNVPGTIELLKEARSRMEAAFQRVSDPMQSFKDAQSTLADTQRARPFLAAGIKVTPTAFDVDLSSFGKIDRVEAEMHAKQEATFGTLSKFDRLATKRLTTALSLLSSPEIASQLEKAADLQKRCQRLLKVAGTLAGQISSAIGLLDQHAVMQMCLQILNANSENEQAANLLRKTARDVVQIVRGMHTTLDHQPYPFDHAKGEISIAAYVFPELPGNDDLGGYFEASEAMSTTLLRLYSRTLGGLCLIAEQVEKVVGLEPLPEAKDEGE